MESLGAVVVDRAELFVPDFCVADPDDFLVGEVRVTVETDFVDSVVVASVSTGGVVASEAVDEAVAVSAADPSERAHPTANRPAANAAASDGVVIDRFPEWSEAPLADEANLSPTLRW
jgi:hypothetical protein